MLFEQLFFCAQILDLDTLHEILSQYNIKSTRWSSLFKKLDFKVVQAITERSLETLIISKLASIYSKSKSTQSRAKITIMIDDSVFSQWLTDTDSFNTLYFKQFSGQYSKSVYGFAPNVLGIVIEGVFYPLYFEILKKGETSNRVYSAIRLLKRWDRFVTKNINLKNLLPPLCLSVDNGYDHKELIEYCLNNNLLPIAIGIISVARKSNLIEIENKKYKIKEYIEVEFLKQEKAFYENGKNKGKPFFIRTKGVYCCKNQEVVFLFFRLKDSKKVTVVYTTHLSIFSKTLRRMWFNRTSIEQFFKLLKHTFRFKKARTKNEIDFTKKLCFYFVIGAFVNQFVKFIKKVPDSYRDGIYDKKYQKFGFARIKKLIQREKIEIPFLEWLIKRPFATIEDCNMFIMNNL